MAKIQYPSSFVFHKGVTIDPIHPTLPKKACFTTFDVCPITGPYSDLPRGLYVNEKGVISGTPTSTSGVTYHIIRGLLCDTGGEIFSNVISIMVNPKPKSPHIPKASLQCPPLYFTASGKKCCHSSNNSGNKDCICPCKRCCTIKPKKTSTYNERQRAIQQYTRLGLYDP